MKKDIDTNTTNTIAKLVRAARKQLGLSQDDLAKKLHLEQSALSRIESGKQILTAPHWIEICRMAGISGNSLITGYIEEHKPSSLLQGGREGNFKISKKYSSNRGSKVRTLIPLFEYFRQIFGQDGLESFIRSKKMSPDFFVNLDNQINIEFSLDIARHLISAGHLKASDIQKLLKPVSLPDTHGRLQYFYFNYNNSLDMLSSLIKNSRHYECNFSYGIENVTNKLVDISVAPEMHMREQKYKDDSDLGDFLCRYKKGYFEQFSTFGGGKGVNIEELECHFKGHPKCVYRAERIS